MTMFYFYYSLGLKIAQVRQNSNFKQDYFGAMILYLQTY